MPVYDGKYIKLKEKNLMMQLIQTFLDDGVTKEDVHHICIIIDSVKKKKQKLSTSLFIRVQI